MKINLQLSLDEVNMVLGGLGQLVANIKEQAQAQIQAAQAQQQAQQQAQEKKDE